MKKVAMAYVAQYFLQTVVALVLGFVWVANAIALGRIIHPEQLLFFAALEFSILLLTLGLHFLV